MEEGPAFAPSSPGLDLAMKALGHPNRVSFEESAFLLMKETSAAVHRRLGWLDGVVEVLDR